MQLLKNQEPHLYAMKMSDLLKNLMQMTYK